LSAGSPEGHKCARILSAGRRLSRQSMSLATSADHSVDTGSHRHHELDLRRLQIGSGLLPFLTSIASRNAAFVGTAASSGAMCPKTQVVIDS